MAELEPKITELGLETGTRQLRLLNFKDRTILPFLENVRSVKIGSEYILLNLIISYSKYHLQINITVKIFDLICFMVSFLKFRKKC